MTDVIPPSAADPVGLPPPPQRTVILGRWRRPDLPSNTYLWVGLTIGFLIILGLAWLGTRALVGPQQPPVPIPPEGATCLHVNGQLVECTTPVTLEVRGRLISVQAQEPAEGAWPYFADHPDYASWVHGTVVNYVLGLATSEENDALFLEVGDSDVFTLTLENDTRLIFRFATYTEADNPAVIFQQQQPALTLVLLGQQREAKPVITGAWTETIPGPGTALLTRGAGPGTPVPAAGATLTVLGGSYLRDPALGLPEGNGYFLVDFSLVYSPTITTTEALNTDAFKLVLADANGISYDPTTAAAAHGRYPPPIGLLLPGETMIATVGYLVDDLTGDVVLWQAQLRPQDPEPLTFAIPFESGPAGEAALAQAVVSVTAVELGPDGSTLVIIGSVANPSQETLSVQPTDAVLSTGLAQSPLTASDPPWPWQVGAGGQLPFRLTFLKPPTQTAIFSLIGRTFALNNIP
jgi:hypothetical protein